MSDNILGDDNPGGNRPKTLWLKGRQVPMVCSEQEIESEVRSREEQRMEYPGRPI